MRVVYVDVTDAILFVLFTASPDERENSDSGFTEIESSRTSQDDCNSDDLFSSPGPRPYEPGIGASTSTTTSTFIRVEYSEETIRDCSFPQPTGQCGSALPEEGMEEDDEYDSDSNSSSVSRLSGLTHLSGCGEDDETPLNPWLRKQIISGVSPRDLLAQLVSSSDIIPHSVSDITLWKIIANTFATPRRQKLKEYHSLDHAVELLQSAKNVVVLTGAGVSVSCGIPDFRSRDGIYSRLSKEYPNLPDPQAMFDIRYFFQDPRPFFKFAREIYPGQFKPSPCHTFIKILESKGKLLRNYTQNIDTLEQVAGIRNVIECHGSFATASCTKCKRKVAADEIRDDVFNQKIPVCQVCNPDFSSPDSTFLNANVEETRSLVERGIMKPDIVFFGEGLPDLFHDTIESDRNKCDLLIVIGSSLKVRPVAMIPNWVSPNVPQILINREPLYHMDTFDINLLGNSDVIAQHLCSLLGEAWDCSDDHHQVKLTECSELLPPVEEPAAVRQKSPEMSSEASSEAPLIANPTVVDPAPAVEEPSSAPLPGPSSAAVDIAVVSSLDAEKPAEVSEPTAAVTLVDTVIPVATKDSAALEDSTPVLSSSLAEEVMDAADEEKADDSDDSDDSDYDEVKEKQRKRSLADRLPENSYYKLAQRVYIFHGAEVYMNSDDEDDEYDDDDESDAENAAASPEKKVPDVSCIDANPQEGRPVAEAAVVTSSSTVAEPDCSVYP